MGEVGTATAGLPHHRTLEYAKVVERYAKYDQQYDGGYGAPQATHDALEEKEADDGHNDDGQDGLNGFHYSNIIVLEGGLFEYLSESNGDGRLKFHALMRDGMVEAELVGMERKAVDGVVAIAVLDVAADRMSHVG